MNTENVCETVKPCLDPRWEHIDTNYTVNLDLGASGPAPTMFTTDLLVLGQ
jgi:hypothetical protein